MIFDLAHVPSQSFLRGLRRLDPLLEAKFIATGIHGDRAIMNRWAIFRKGKLIMLVEKHGKYCDLDNRTLYRLYEIDSQRYPSAKAFVNQLRLDDEMLYRRKRKEQDETVRDIHRDMQPILRGRRSVSFGGNQHNNAISKD